MSVSASVPVISNSVLKCDPHHTSDKKYNIVLFGVEECSVGTSRHECMESDTDNVIKVVSSIDNSIQKHSIKDCFRLGKLNRTSDRARPILVKFVRTADVSRIMSKKASLKLPFFVKTRPFSGGGVQGRHPPEGEVEFDSIRN